MNRRTKKVLVLVILAVANKVYIRMPGSCPTRVEHLPSIVRAK